MCLIEFVDLNLVDNEESEGKDSKDKKTETKVEQKFYIFN